MTATPRIAFLASRAADAQAALAEMQAVHGQHEPDDADVLCALGGDGFMLQTLHRYGPRGLPVYGMKLGTIGFLMNHYMPEGLVERITAAHPAQLRPLEMTAITEAGATATSLAYNRESPCCARPAQAAHIRIHLNDRARLDELVCDGVLVATPAGSTAYNFSAHGPILPFGANVIALTPIAPFRPRRWRGALLRAETVVRFETLDPDKRPVSVTADSHEVRDVTEVIGARVEGSWQRDVAVRPGAQPRGA